MKKILMTPGPGCQVYASFSSCSRPTMAVVQKSMEDLQAAELGISKVVNTLGVFYKELPSLPLQPKLAAHGMSLEEYTVLFRKDERLTSHNRDEILKQLPEALAQ